MGLGRTTPISRMFDEAKAKEFHVDFLGFKVDWERSFEPDMRLYVQISKYDCILRLSEHDLDCWPGAALIEITELTAKDHRCYRPGLEEVPWGRDMSVKHPLATGLTFTALSTEQLCCNSFE